MKKILYAFLFSIVIFLEPLSSQVIWQDDFDTYVPDSIIDPQSTDWIGWGNTVTSAYVSDDTASTPSNSLKIWNASVPGSTVPLSDVIRHFGNQTSGRYMLRFKVYVPSTVNGQEAATYWNILHAVNASNTGTEWAMDVQIRTQNNPVLSSIQTGGVFHYFQAKYDQWVEVVHIFDLDNDQSDFFYDGQLVSSEPFSYQTLTTTGTNQLAAIDLFANCDGTSNCTEVGYFDDFVFENFPFPSNDAAVMSIDSPAAICAGPADVYATIGNFGINQIDTVTIEWEVNGVPQTPVLYTQTLDTINGANPYSAQVFLGSANFVSGSNDIKVYTSNPNNVADTTTYNDTATVNLQTGTPPTGMTVLSSTSLTANILVAGATGNIDYEYGTTGFTLGTGISGSSATNPVNITGLFPSTTYDIYFRNDCGSSQSAWAGPFSFVTPCATFTPPYFETFDNTTTPQCWTETGATAWSYSTNAGYGAAVAGDHTGNSGNYAWMDGSNNTAGEVSSLLTPLIDVSTLTTPMLNYWVFSNNIDDAALNKLNIDLFDGANWNSIDSVEQNFGPNWVERYVDLSPYTITGPIQIRFTVTGSNVGSPFFNDILLDDVAVIEAPTCFEPINLGTSNLTLTTANLDWTEVNTATSWEIEYGPTGFAIGTGTRTMATTNPHTLTGLSPSTTYDYYVRSACGRNDTSFWAGPESFNTANGVPFVEDFESFPAGITSNPWPRGWTSSTTTDPKWESEISTGNNVNSFATGPLYDHTFYGIAGGMYIYMETSGGTTGDTAFFVSPPIFVDTNQKDLQLDYWYFNHGADIERMEVYIRSNGTDSLIATYIGQQQPNQTDPWLTATHYISGYEGSTVEIVFMGINAPCCSGDLAIDDVSLVVAPPACTGIPDPSTITGPASVCPGDPFQLTASGMSAGPGISYDWQYYDSTASAWVSTGGGFTTENIAGGIFDPTSFRFITNCNNSGLNDTSNVIMVTLNPPLQCYCTPIYTNGCTFGDDINSVTLNGVNGTSINDLNTGCSANGYDDRTSLPTVELVAGLASQGTISSSFGNQYAKIWIDFNDDGFFVDSTELVGTVGPIGNTATPYTLNIPSTADSGVHRMRIRSVYFGTGFTFDACGSQTYGEAHDYTTRVITPSCAVPSNLSASNIGMTSADLAWVENGLSTDWEIEYGVTGFTLGTGTRVLTTLNPHGITGLSPSSTYDFYVRSICGRADSSFWAGPESFNTANGVPFVEDFESFPAGITANPWPRGWTSSTSTDPKWESEISTGNNVNSFATGPLYDHTFFGIAGGMYIYMETSGGVTGDSAFFVSPPIYVDTSQKNLQLDYWYFNHGVDIERMEVYIRSNGVDSLLATYIGQQQVNQTDPWLTATHYISGYEGSTVEIVFMGINAPCCSGDLAIDDVSLVVAPNSCAGSPDPSTITGPMTVCAGDPFQLTASGMSVGPGISYDWQYYDSTASAWVSTGGGFTTENVANGIFDPTSFRFITSCSNSGLNDTSNVIMVTLNPPSQCYCTPVYTNGCTFGDDINSVTLNGVNGTSINDLNTGCSTNAYDDRTSLPTVELVAGLAAQGTINANFGSQYAKIWIDFNDDGFFVDSTELVGTVGPIGTTATPYTLNIPAGADSGVHRMRYRSVYFGTGFTFDACGSQSFGETHDYTTKIIIPSCPVPSNLSVGNLGLSSADLAWIENGTSTEWEVEFGLAGFPLGTGTRSNTTLNPYGITGLSPSTAYGFYVRSICGRADTSFWAGPFVFSTSAGIPYFQDFEAFGQNTAGINNIEGWNSTSTFDPQWESGTLTTSTGTGPTVDHTIGTGGTFMYLETSGGVQGDFDELTSPPIYVDTAYSSLTLEFWYHMHGATMDDLEVYIIANGVPTLVTTISGQQQPNQTDPWLQYTTNLTGYAGTSIELMFKGIRGSSFTGDMAIDDVLLTSTLVGEQEKMVRHNVSISPNPSKGVFNLIGHNVEDEIQVNIYNTSGQIVYQLDKKVSNDFNQQIDLSGLAKGIYFVRLQGESSMEMKKVVIQ